MQASLPITRSRAITRSPDPSGSPDLPITGSPDLIPSPRLSGEYYLMAHKQKRQPRFELPFPDEGAPSERPWKNLFYCTFTFSVSR
jgi:hypothetical protein